MTENETITVDLESFAFWQAEMAHASAKAKNNPKHDGDSIHRAYKQMFDVLQEYHEPSKMEGNNDRNENKDVEEYYCEWCDEPLGTRRYHLEGKTTPFDPNFCSELHAKAWVRDDMWDRIVENPIVRTKDVTTENDTFEGVTVSRELSERDRMIIKKALGWLADSNNDTYDTDELHDLAEYVAYGAEGGLTSDE